MGDKLLKVCYGENIIEISEEGIVTKTTVSCIPKYKSGKLFIPLRKTLTDLDAEIKISYNAETKVTYITVPTY